MIPDDAAIETWLAARQPFYRYRKPRYQVRLIQDLGTLLPSGTCRLLDIGAGSGLIAEAISGLYPGKWLTGVDVAQRVLPALRVPFVKFDGRRLPFADAAFDGALFCNVLHHVTRDARAPLLREALLVTGGGPLIMKDHVADSLLDHWKLACLEFVGNVPFGGMVSAEYLGAEEWRRLFDALGCDVERAAPSDYRGALSNWLFPNRLEQCFRVQSRRQP